MCRMLDRHAGCAERLLSGGGNRRAQAPVPAALRCLLTPGIHAACAGHLANP